MNTKIRKEIEKEINDLETDIYLLERRLDSRKLVFKYTKLILEITDDDPKGTIKRFIDDNSRSNMDFDMLLSDSEDLYGKTINGLQRYLFEENDLVIPVNVLVFVLDKKGYNLKEVGDDIEYSWQF